MPKLFDRVKVNIATTGTGDVTFGSASSNAFLTPTEAGCVDTDTVRYVIVDGTDYEEGIGTIASSVATMARTTVTKSKIGGVAGTTKITLSGTAVLALVASASDIVNPADNLSDVLDKNASRENIAAAPKKNYIINGAMMVSQENGSAAGTTFGYYPVDIFGNISFPATGTYSVARVSSITPAGSPNRLRFTVTAAEVSPGSSEAAQILYAAEGIDVADLKLGTSDAEQIVLQFGVKAPAGTYCVAFLNGAGDRSYVAEYTIAAGEANTDVVKSVALTLDTTGTWLKDNGTGLSIRFVLMAGTGQQGSGGAWLSGAALATSNQFNLFSTNGNIFELFDVGLYKGSIAPTFEVPEYTETLKKCQRYWAVLDSTMNSFAQFGMGSILSTTTAIYVVNLPERLRALPTFSASAAADFGGTAITADVIDVDRCRINMTGTFVRAGDAANLQAANTLSAKLMFNARL